MEILGQIIIAIITGGLALIGVIITNSKANDKFSADLKISQAVTDAKIENLTSEVREHNGFAKKIPVIESKLETIEKRIDKLEQR